LFEEAAYSIFKKGNKIAIIHYTWYHLIGES
jgi:hypothetical protein